MSNFHSIKIYSSHEVKTVRVVEEPTANPQEFAVKPATSPISNEVPLQNEYKIRRISMFDGRKTVMKRGKQVSTMLFRLLTLAVILAYVISVTFGASRASSAPESIKPTVEVIENHGFAVQENIDKGKSEVLVPTNSPTPTPTASPVPTKLVQSNAVGFKPTRKGIYRFVSAYPGSRVNAAYVDSLYSACGNDTYSVAVVLAIATAETGLGRDTKNKTNFYGWFKGGNRSYDPALETIAKDLCNAVKGSYKGIETNKNKVITYTGSDRPDTHYKAMQWAMTRMGIE